MRRKLAPLALVLIFLLIALPALLTAAEKIKDDRVVKAGMIVSIEYTVKGSDGKLIESSKGQGPLQYIHGRKAMIPGLEKELEGMKIGGEKHVTVKPEDGYGRIDSKAVQEVPKDQIPPNGLKVGAILATKTLEGQVKPLRIRQIKEKTVVVDMNHPLAGKTLVFDVKVVDIQPMPPPPAQPAKPAAPAAPALPAKPAEPAKK